MSIYQGQTADLEVKENRIAIKKKFHFTVLVDAPTFLDFLFKGTEEIPMRQLSSMEWREPNALIDGQLKLLCTGGKTINILFSKGQRNGMAEAKEKIYSLLK